MDFVRSDIAIAFAIRAARSLGRDPSVQQSLKNWASTSELAHVSPLNPVWLNWCGYLLFVAPVLIWMSIRTPRNGAQGLRALPFYVLLIARISSPSGRRDGDIFFCFDFSRSRFQRWLAPIKSSAAVWIAFVLSIFPILRDWDELLWPNEARLAGRVERGLNPRRIRDLALSFAIGRVHPFLAPWVLSAVDCLLVRAAWSRGKARHESLNESRRARDFFFRNLEQLMRFSTHTEWRGFSYDSDRVAQNSCSRSGQGGASATALRVLYQTPSQAPPFLIFPHKPYLQTLTARC